MFSALSIGATALQASQTALNVVGQNIANASTPGYDEEVPVLSEIVNGNQTGAGVLVEGINRQRDNIVEAAYTTGQSESGALNTQVSLLGQVENSINSGTGRIDSQFTGFFNDVQQLIANPSDLVQRQTVLGQGQPVDTLYQGDQLFQAPGQDVFQALVGLRDLLNNTGNLSQAQQVQALSQQLNPIQQARQGVLSTVGEQSASLQNLSSLQTNIQNTQLQTKALIQNLSGADVAQVLTQLSQQQNTFETTLSTTGQLFSPSMSPISFLAPG